jgi:hypothetical protein
MILMLIEATSLYMLALFLGRWFLNYVNKVPNDYPATDKGHS